MFLQNIGGQFEQMVSLGNYNTCTDHEDQQEFPAHHQAYRFDGYSGMPFQECE
jgi:hypothetical protein